MAMVMVPTTIARKKATIPVPNLTMLPMTE